MRVLSDGSSDVRRHHLPDTGEKAPDLRNRAGIDRSLCSFNFFVSACVYRSEESSSAGTEQTGQYDRHDRFQRNRRMAVFAAGFHTYLSDGHTVSGAVVPYGNI